MAVIICIFLIQKKGGGQANSGPVSLGAPHAPSSVKPKRWLQMQPVNPDWDKQKTNVKHLVNDCKRFVLF